MRSPFALRCSGSSELQRVTPTESSRLDVWISNRRITKDFVPATSWRTNLASDTSLIIRQRTWYQT